MTSCSPAPFVLLIITTFEWCVTGHLSLHAPSRRPGLPAFPGAEPGCIRVRISNETSFGDNLAGIMGGTIMITISQWMARSLSSTYLRLSLALNNNSSTPGSRHRGSSRQGAGAYFLPLAQEQGRNP